jgi:chromosome segregation and condensation protein ScpB
MAGCRGAYPARTTRRRGHHQPITRAGVSDIIGHEASRDIIAALRDKNMITAGPRSPTPGGPFTYVTTKGFLEHFGLDTLRNLPDLEARKMPTAECHGRRGGR